MSVILKMQGLPLSASSSDVRNFFSGLHIPDGCVSIIGGEEGEVFVGFTEDEDARKAMRRNNGCIHNAEVRLFLSSMKEMKEVIDNASRSAPPSNTQRYSTSVPSSTFEKSELPRLIPREDQSRCGRDGPPSFGGNGMPFTNNEHLRYGRERTPPISSNGRIPITPYGGFPTETGHNCSSEQGLDDRRGGREGGGIRDDMERSYQSQNPCYESEKVVSGKSVMDEVVGRHAPWMNRDTNPMGSTNQRSGRYGPGMYGNEQQVRERQNARHDPAYNRQLESGFFGNGRDDDKRNEVRNKEESWRSENNLSFGRVPHITPDVSCVKEEEQVSFFGRGHAHSKRPLLPSPLIPPQSLISPPLPSNVPTPQPPKEEVFVEMTRLPPELLRPSVLEQFLSPTIPLNLSSVKVVYSPEGIHLHSLVRFTSAMDAFNALKKDGEQGVKIRPSTKEAFDIARDGPMPSISHIPQSINPSLPHPSSFSPFTPPMGGIPPPINCRPNIFTMPRINPNVIMGNERRGLEGTRIEIDYDRGERRKREDSPLRGIRDQRRRRSNSPRAKKMKGERVCVHISNLPFRTKEPDIRRMLGPGLNPFAIKKIFNEDNAPSDIWIMEFATEREANETVHRRMEMGGRSIRSRRIDEPEADRLLRQKFKSPPRRGEKEDAKIDSFDEKVRMQQEAIEMEKLNMNKREEFGEEALAGAFSAPVFTRNRGFMRGGRGGGRGLRGEFRGMRNGGTRGRGRGGGYIGGMRTEEGHVGGGGKRNCLLVSNMPPIPVPQILLEHLHVNPSLLVRIDQIAPDAAIIELTDERDAMGVADTCNDAAFPSLNGRRLIVAAMGRRQIEEEFNLRRGEIKSHQTEQGPSCPKIDPEMIGSIGDTGCVVACHGFPRDLTIDEVKSFFDGFPIKESSVRMRMERGMGTGECLLAFGDMESARRAVQSLNGTTFKHCRLSLTLLS